MSGFPKVIVRTDKHGHSQHVRFVDALGESHEPVLPVVAIETRFDNNRKSEVVVTFRATLETEPAPEAPGAVGASS